MSEKYSQKTINALVNAGYELGKTLEKQTSKAQANHYVSNLNEYYHYSFDKFRNYLMTLYTDSNLNVPESIRYLILNESSFKIYASSFLIGWMGKPIKEQAE